jgi:DNA helicase IV
MINVEYSDQINLARRHIRHFSYIAKAKGLEFDVVVLANVDGYDLKNPTQINRLYVGITRARKELILLKSSKNFGFQFQKVWARYQGLVGLSATVEYH